MVDAVMVPSSNTNCINDVDEFLLTLTSVDQKAPADQIAPHSSAYDRLLEDLPASVRDLLSVCSLPPEEETSLDKQEFNVIAYIAGYIVRKLRKVVCNICVANITSEICDENEFHEFIKKKNM